MLYITSATRTLTPSVGLPCFPGALSASRVWVRPVTIHLMPSHQALREQEKVSLIVLTTPALYHSPPWLANAFVAPHLWCLFLITGPLPYALLQQWMSLLGDCKLELLSQGWLTLCCVSRFRRRGFHTIQSLRVWQDLAVSEKAQASRLIASPAVSVSW